MEMQIDNLYKEQYIRGFCHLYDGQEAVIFGIENACTWDDPIVTGYRNHVHSYTRGFTTFQIIAELMGKQQGATNGIGGSMHYYNKKSNYYGGHGIVGAQTSIGTGLAFALKYLNKPNVALTMYGDGASNQGQLFESTNMAKLWNLPCLYIIENNKYGMGTQVNKSSQQTEFYKRGELVPGILIDGQNYFEVKSAIQACKKWSIENGPMYIEVDCYRYHGHSMSDPGLSYRTREEVNDMRQNRDPINLIKNTILQNKLATEDELKQINKKIKDIISDDIKRAKEDVQPSSENIFKNTYIDNENHFIRGVTYEESQFIKK